MSTVVEVLARLRADSSQFNRAMQDAANSTEKVKTSSIGLGTMLGTLGARAVEYGVDGLKSMSMMGLQAASDYQQAQIAFTTMLGSADKANKFLSELRVMAAKTPFELPDLLTGTRRLLGMGFAAQDTTKVLTAIGDASSGLGVGASGIDRMTLALGQMKAKGRVASGELTQMAELGVPALQYLADGFGVTTAQMTKMIEKGAVPADKGIKMIVDGMEKGTKNARGFGGMMAAQSQTLQGVWSTLVDTFRNGLVDAVMPYVPALSKVVSAATPLVGPVMKGLLSAFAGLISMISALVQLAIPGFQEVWQAIQPGVQAVSDFKDGIQGIGTALGGTGSLFNDLGLGVRAAVQAFQDGDVTSNGLVGRFEQLGVAARVLYDSVGKQVVSAFQQFAAIAIPAAQQLADKVRSDLIPVMVRIGSAVGPIIVQVASFFANKLLPEVVRMWAFMAGQLVPFITGSVVPAFLQIMSALADAVIPTVQALWEVFQNNLWPAIVAVYGAVKVATVAFFQVAGPVLQLIAIVAVLVLWILSKLIPILIRLAGPIVQVVVTGLAWIVSAIAKVIGIIGVMIGWVIRVGAAIASWVASAIGRIGAINAAWNVAKGVVAGFVSSVAGRMAAFGSAVVGGVSKVGQFLSGARSKLADLLGIFTGLPGKIKGAFSGAGTLLWDIGSQIVNGLVAGIKAAWGKVTGAISALVDKIPGPIRSLLGISSPSKVTAEIGRYVSEGLAVGILANVDKVAAASLAVANAAIPRVGDPRMAFAGAGGLGFGGGGQVVIQEGAFQMNLSLDGSSNAQAAGQAAADGAQRMFEAFLRELKAT